MHIPLEPPYLIIKPGISEDEFYRLAGEDSDWEYLDGRVFMHSPATDRHEDIFCFLLTLLRAFLGEQGGAIVRGSRYPMRLDANWSPEPDLLVVRDGRRCLMTPRWLSLIFRPAEHWIGSIWMSWGGSSCVMSTICAEGLIERITPFIAAAK